MPQTPHRFFRHFCLTSIILSLAAVANAQYKAGIEGTVTDTSGAVLPGAAITVTNQETGVSHHAAASPAGFYRVPALPPGRYTVSASSAGFRQHVVTDIGVAAEAIQAVNITLQPGDVKQTVTVSGSVAPALQTENGNLSSSLSSLQITRLPQVGHDPYELLRLTPGIFGDGARDGGGNSVGLPNTTGPGGSNSSVFQTENQVPVSSAGPEKCRRDGGARRTAYHHIMQPSKNNLEPRGLVDFFDTNSVGSDSHLQFMNWTVDNNGAYDYAANTRGYTWGASGAKKERQWMNSHDLIWLGKWPW